MFHIQDENIVDTKYTTGQQSDGEILDKSILHFPATSAEQ